MIKRIIILLVLTLVSYSQASEFKILYKDGTTYVYDISNGSGTLQEIKLPDGSVKTTFEYDQNGKLLKEKDGLNPTTDYKQYLYDPVSGDLTGYELHSSGDIRSYEYLFDENGKLEGVKGSSGSGGCGTCGGTGMYTYYPDGRVHKEYYLKSAVKHFYREYAYDNNGDISNVWLVIDDDGLKENVKVFVRTTIDGAEVVDKKDYVTATDYRITREFLNSLGDVTKRYTYDKLNENPDSPTGDVVVENIIYNRNEATGELESKVVISPKGAPSGDGIRLEAIYSYEGAGTSRYVKSITEKKYDNNNVEMFISTNEFNSDKNLDKTLDQAGGETKYTYTQQETVLQETMPDVIATNLSDRQRLAYKNTYYSSGRNKGKLEKRETIKITNFSSLTGTPIMTEHYAYDDHGRLEKMWFNDSDARANPASQITQYYYNGFGDKIWEVSPSGVVTGSVYNDFGKLESTFVLAGGWAWFSNPVYIDPYDYTATNLMVISQVKYTYDNATGKTVYVDEAVSENDFLYGDTTSVSWVRTEYVYDRFGRKTSVIADALALDEQQVLLAGFNASPMQLKTTYEYNLQDEVVKVKYPDGKWVKTVRDGRGLVVKQIVSSGAEYAENLYVPGVYTQISGVPYQVTSNTYDANGNLVETINPDGTRDVRKYDDYDRLVTTKKLPASN